MANIFKISQSVILTEEDINKTTRFIDEAISHEPISYSNGKVTLPGNTIDFQIATNQNFITLILEKGANFTVKVGDTTAPSITNCKMITVDASSNSVFISNPNTDSVELTYFTAKY